MFLKKEEEGKYHIMLNFSVNCNWLLTYSMYKLLKSKLFDFLIKKKKKNSLFLDFGHIVPHKFECFQILHFILILYF